MIRLSVLSILASSILLQSHELGNGEQKKSFQPNLLIIQTDEHSFRTLGCYREQLSHDQAFVWGEGNHVETPNIDYLAGNGILFSKFYAATPVCSPSRATLVSGMYPQQAGVPKNNISLDDDVISYAEVLSQNGYKTGFIGKWHLAGVGRPYWTPEKKFGFEDNLYMYNRGHWKKMENTPAGPRVASVDGNGNPDMQLNGADEVSFTTDFLTDRGIEFIERNKAYPFSLYISYPDPHGPDRVRPPYDEMYTHMDFQAPVTYNKPDENVPEWAEKVVSDSAVGQAQYFGMVKCIDDNVGRLLDYLREKLLIQNTIIIFTSDHGDLRAEHHRHNKGVPLEASAKIPFIVYYPKRIPPGKEVNLAFSTVDIAPSILGFMKKPIPEQMVGRDFSGLLVNPENQKDWEDIVFIRSTGFPGEGRWVAAVTSRFKLVLGWNDKPWLIDMEEDPNEVINFIDAPGKADVVKVLARKLSEYAEKHNDPFLHETKMADDLNHLLMKGVI